MKLPNADRALVEREKIIGYLLNAQHPDNGGKAAFFFNLGFHVDDCEVMPFALRRLALTGEVTNIMESVHGKKYIVDGAIETPSGKAPVVRSVWIVDAGEIAPRLVTAYPGD